MWCRLRKTLSRGRAPVPLSDTRIRRWRRARAARVSRGLNMILSRLLLLGAGLTGLATDDFFGVLDPFAFVRLGRTHAADLRRRLTDQLLVGAADGNGVSHDREADPGWCRNQYRVRVADLQHQIAARNGGTIADAVDLQAAGVPVGHAGHHIGDQATREPVQRAMGWLVRRALHAQLTIVAHDVDLARDLAGELAF